MNDAQPARPVYDRTTEDVGNIVELGHVNIRIDDQRLATLFYIMGLGLTRDPYLVVGVDNMWVNAGTCQFHLPMGKPQVLRGTTGLVVPDLEALAERLATVAPRLADTRFTWKRTGNSSEGNASKGNASKGDAIEATCPWGNRMRLHAPDEARFGRMLLGMPYVEVDVAPGTTEGIARFYREVLANPAVAGRDARGAFARVPIGLAEALVFRETDAALPSFDGHHVQIAIADFSGVHARLLQRGLITEESSQSQYRFQDIVDLDSGQVLATIEHEVRSMRHPMFARTMTNRNPGATNNVYASGYEAAMWRMPPV